MENFDKHFGWKVATEAGKNGQQKMVAPSRRRFFQANNKTYHGYRKHVMLDD
jgi:hypothetical protein